MHRTTTKEFRKHRKYDFLADVDGDRLKLIGAISLAWNWLEAIIDTTLATCLGLHPEMWVEVQSRINGFDGKVAIIKASLPTLASDAPEEFTVAVSKCLNAAANIKRVRDHIIHMRLARPEEEVSESFLRQGKRREVYTSTAALLQYYRTLHALIDEIELMSTIYFRISLSHVTPEPSEKLQEQELARRCLPLFLDSQKKREGLPPLRELPEPDPAQEAAEVAEYLRGMKG